mmetsp:Transcript_69073/g.101214  ORF Transcript_69073/g.101214 Transcript_69073/m.101214 type:complete len:223 (+) Transcript_69073:1160-1828(+)
MHSNSNSKNNNRVNICSCSNSSSNSNSSSSISSNSSNRSWRTALGRVIPHSAKFPVRQHNLKQTASSRSSCRQLHDKTQLVTRRRRASSKHPSNCCTKHPSNTNLLNSTNTRSFSHQPMDKHTQAQAWHMAGALAECLRAAGWAGLLPTRLQQVMPLDHLLAWRLITCPHTPTLQCRPRRQVVRCLFCLRASRASGILWAYQGRLLAQGLLRRDYLSPWPTR